jgi:hypothetical protein
MGILTKDAPESKGNIGNIVHWRKRGILAANALDGFT